MTAALVISFHLGLTGLDVVLQLLVQLGLDSLASEQQFACTRIQLVLR